MQKTAQAGGIAAVVPLFNREIKIIKGFLILKWLPGEPGLCRGLLLPEITRRGHAQRAGKFGRGEFMRGGAMREEKGERPGQAVPCTESAGAWGSLSEQRAGKFGTGGRSGALGRKRLHAESGGIRTGEIKASQPF